MICGSLRASEETSGVEVNWTSAIWIMGQDELSESYLGHKADSMIPKSTILMPDGPVSIVYDGG